MTVLAGLEDSPGSMKSPKPANNSCLKDIGRYCIVTAAFSIASRNHEAV